MVVSINAPATQTTTGPPSAGQSAALRAADFVVVCVAGAFIETIALPAE